jgi:Icc-related predicted phosphoesterase
MRLRTLIIGAVFGLTFSIPGFSAENKSPETPLFIFAVNSDPHVSDNRTGEPTGKEKFKILLSQVQKRSPKPDFLLINGDIHVKPFTEALAESKAGIPIHLVPGNHEQRQDRDALQAMFPADFKGNDFYSFIHKGSLFIGLCDVGNGDHIGHFNSEAIKGPEQGEWLKKQLADNRKQVGHIFIFGHIPPHPEGKIDNGMSLSVNDQKFLRELVLEYKPTAMFFGHLHHAMEFKIGPTPVIVVPSSNWNFNNESLGFLEVKVYKSRIETEFIPLNFPKK